MKHKSRESGTANKSRESGTANKSRESGTANKSRESGTVKRTEVFIEEYQHAWPLQCQQVVSELREAGIEFELEHIGSTSVPGLCAKPVLDLMLGVNALHALQPYFSALHHLGFVYRPEYEDQLPDRRYFVRAAGATYNSPRADRATHNSRRANRATMRVHLHAVVTGGALWLQHLKFRDRLRNHQETRQAYATLKRELAQRHASDKAAYGRAKDPFILQVLSNA